MTNAPAPVSEPTVSAVPDRSAALEPAAVVDAPDAHRVAPVAASPNLVLQLNVFTRASLMPNAAIVPDITVEAGLDAPGDGPVPALVSGTSDAQARAVLAVPWSAVEAVHDRPGARLWLRVATKGYQARTTTRRLLTSPGSLDVTLIAYPGSTLRGRLLDCAGKPVAGTVYAKAWTKSGSLGIGAIGRALEDGWFEVTPYQAGNCQILADAGEHGTAVKADVSSTETDELELRACGPGIVRGRVRDSRGQAVPALQLLVIVAELDDENGSFILPEPRASQLQMEGRGHEQVTLTTGADGSFEALGLREDTYIVRGRTDTRGPYPLRLTHAPVASNATPLDLWLDAPRIVVHVVGEDGQPYADLKTDEERNRKHGVRPGTPPERWPEKADVVVLPVRETAFLEEVFQPQLVGRGGGAGTMVFDVTEARSYRVGLIGGNSSWHPLTVDVPFGSGRIDVTLTAASAPLGTLVVRAEDPEGAKVRRIHIRIEDELDGAPLLVRKPMYEAESTQSFRLPEGSYRVTIDSVPMTDSQHGALMIPAAFGRYEEQVRIVRDASTEVTARLPKGARLQLKVPGEVLEVDRTALHDLHPTWTYGGPIDGWAGRVNLWLCSDGHWPIPVAFTYVMSGSSAAGTHVGDWIPIGTEATSQLLPAGKYRLVGRMSGGRSGELDVVLVDGETTAATLELH